MVEVGTVERCWQYPVKSMQGHELDALTLRPSGVVGDRAWGLLDAETGHVLSAKRLGRLLGATGHADRIELPDGTIVATDDRDASATLSGWLGREVRLARPSEGEQAAYQMTFDPPDDDAELFEIPTPPGTFLDLADVHLLTTATLAGCAAARPDLDWDERRFRPNLVVAADGDVFMEQDWVGGRLRLGDQATIEVLMPTVRCAMPLRAQPPAGDAPGLERQPELFGAMTELNTASPNHLGVYASVVVPGEVRVGDPVVFDAP
jgi:uncharacterized protein